MSILEIDYENIKVNKHYLRDRTLFTIDNFYKYPNSLIAKFRQFEDESAVRKVNKYPGTQITFNDIFNSNEAAQHYEDIKTLLASCGFDQSRFVPLQNDSGGFSKFSHDVAQNKVVSHSSTCMNNPHYDRTPELFPTNALACLCYLSKDVHGGTGVYFNKLLQTFCSNSEYVARNICDLHKNIRGAPKHKHGAIIKAHLLNKVDNLFPGKAGYMNKSNEHFDIIHYFPMKFNRFIVYEGDLFHSMCIEDEEFFKFHERLTTNYFFDITWDENIKDESLKKELSLIPDCEISNLVQMIHDVESSTPPQDLTTIS